jgi:hypothetical protein
MAGGKPPFRNQSVLGILKSFGRSLFGSRPKSSGRFGKGSAGASGGPPGAAPASIWTPPMIVATAALVIVIVVSIVVLQHVYSSGSATPNPLGSGTALPAPAATAVPVQLQLSAGTPITPTTIVGGANGASTLLGPTEAVRGPDKLYYVADPGNHRVAVLNGKGKVVRSITAGAQGTLQAPSSLALTPDGNLVVLDSDSGFVTEYTTQGKLVTSSPRSVPMIHARGLSVDTQGQIYVADPATDSVFTLDTGLNIIHQETASPDGGKTFLFRQPTAVVPAPGGGFYVVDGQVGQLDLFTATWQPIRSWPLAIGDTLHSPRVLPLTDGKVLVTDPSDSKLLLFTPDATQPTFYALNTVPGALPSPLGLSIVGKKVLLTCTGVNQLWLLSIPGLL